MLVQTDIYTMKNRILTITNRFQQIVSRIVNGWKNLFLLW